MEHKIKIKLGKNRVSQKPVGKFSKLRYQSDLLKVGKVHEYSKLSGKEDLIFFGPSFFQSSQCDENPLNSVVLSVPEPLLSGKTEHEVTREHISERIDKLASDLANKEDLLKVKVEIIEKIELESIQIQKVLKDEIFELKENLLRYLPHKMTFRIAIYFISLFLFAFSADMLGVQIIKPFWNLLGISVSGGFLIMAYFLFLDWQKSNVNRTDG